MNKIYITGPMGSDRKSIGEKMAKDRNMPLIDLDQVIEKEDGRTIKMLSKMMGEHAYHDKEYHKLVELDENDEQEFVMICGDGILFDSMCEDIMRKGEIIIADWEKSIQELWEQAKQDETLPYAFLDLMRIEEKRLGNCEEFEKIEKSSFDRFVRLFEERKKYFEKYVK